MKGSPTFMKRQSFNALKYREILEYNKLFNKLLEDCYNDYIDSLFDVYEGVFSEERIEEFNSIVRNIRGICMDSSSDDVAVIVELLESGYISDKEFNNKVVYTVFGTYCRELSYIITEKCQERINDIVTTNMNIFLETIASRHFMCLDNKFIKTSIKRFDNLLDKVSKSSIYVNSIFVEERCNVLVERLKSPVIEDCISVVSKYCNFELDLVEISSLVSQDLDNCEDPSNRVVYIDDYRRLNKLALDNGFEYIRSKGDHGIYKNKNGTVVIPQGRTIGKGLSCKIQKAISSLA